MSKEGSLNRYELVHDNLFIYLIAYLFILNYNIYCMSILFTIIYHYNASDIQVSRSFTRERKI